MTYNGKHKLWEKRSQEFRLTSLATSGAALHQFSYWRTSLITACVNILPNGPTDAISILERDTKLYVN